MPPCEDARVKRSVTAVLLVTLTVLSARAQPDPRPAQPQTDGRRAAIQDLLERRAAAVRAGDLTGFLATERDAPPPVRARHTTWFRRIRALPVEGYELTLDDDGYTDLSAGLRARPRAEDVLVVPVQERFAIRGYDAEPTTDSLYLTVARSAAGWSVVNDADLEELGLLSARNLWDFGPVRTVERDGVLVITRGTVAVAERIARATSAALRFVRGRWPFRLRARAVVLIPATATELERILRTASDIGPFAAFTSSSVERRRGAFHLVGHRIYVQPGTFFDAGTAFQDDVLGHEILHLATRPLAGAFTPAWLDEGVAQVLGERAPQRTATFERAARSGVVTALPRDHEFSTGSRGSIDIAYEASASFAAFLRARFGSGALARLYRAVGAESPVSFGTARYHHDRATTVVLKTGLRTLERMWLRAVRRRT